MGCSRRRIADLPHVEGVDFAIERTWLRLKAWTATDKVEDSTWDLYCEACSRWCQNSHRTSAKHKKRIQDYGANPAYMASLPPPDGGDLDLQEAEVATTVADLPEPRREERRFDSSHMSTFHHNEKPLYFLRIDLKRPNWTTFRITEEEMESTVDRCCLSPLSPWISAT